MYNVDQRTKLFVYPKLPNEREYYLIDEEGKEKYITHNNMQNYAFNTPEKEEIFAKDNNNLEYYAKNDHKEIYAIDLKKDFEKFITINNENQYTKNKYNIEFYPIDFIGRNRVAENQNNFFYAKGENQKMYYPLDEFGNEFAVRDKITGEVLLIMSENEPIVPQKRNGSVNYEKIGDLEIPYTHNNVYFVGKNAAGDGQYPKDSENKEYYPDNNTNPKFASDRNGNYVYAVDEMGNIIFPSISDEEIYIKDNNLDSFSILKNSSGHFTQYAKSKEREIYPIKVLKSGKHVEMLMFDLYAKTYNSKMFYPKDSNNNDYVNRQGTLLDSYPITSDGNIIIPNHNNTPLIKSNDSHLSKQIKCLLYRPEFKRYDFLLNCFSKKYPLLHSKSFSVKTNLKYFIAALCAIAFILFFILVIK